MKNWDFHQDSIYALDVSDNFKKILTGSRNGEIYITDLSRGAYTKIDNLKEPITSVALSSDNDLSIFASTSKGNIYEYVYIILNSVLKLIQLSQN